jgi:hypothetical protein
MADMGISGQVCAHVAIDAPADVVWSVLTDFPSHARWNPYIVAIAGEPRGGAKLMVEVEDADQTVSRFRADVVRCVAGRELCFVERRIAGLMRREYGFRIDPGPGPVRLVSWFECRGIGRGVARQRWQTRAAAGLEAMMAAIREVAEAGSVEAWLRGRMPAMSTHYRWRPVYQARLYHEVAKAVDIIRRSPRAVEQLSLTDWTLGVSEQGKRYVGCDGALRIGYRAENVPDEPCGRHPIIVGKLRGKTFVLDGAHRIASNLLAGQTMIPAVWLSEGETAACVRDGFELKVRFESITV